jgi:hypothetical protein
MGELREIVSVEAIGRLFALLALGLPLMGVAIGMAWGMRRKEVRRGALWGLAVGLLGPLNWLMWQLYNALTDRNGLDTVRNVFVNLAVFVVVGLSLGFGAGMALRRTLRTRSDESMDTPAPPEAS